MDKLKATNVTTRWEARKILQRKFFLRWQEEYLDSLKKRTRALVQEQGLKKGDVVLLSNERKTRISWPIARVEELFYSRDNKARSVLLRLPSEMTKKELAQTGSDIDKRNWKFQPPKFVKRGVETLALLESDLTNKEMTREGEPSSNQL